MLVDVVELRERGRRRSAEAVKAARPIRGLLRLSTSSRGWYMQKAKAPLVALLLCPDGRPEGLLEVLDDARVVEIHARGMLIVGTQAVRTRGRRYDEYPQAWWIRPVGQPPSPSSMTGQEKMGHATPH